jgi:hypothetical protein
MTMFTKPTFLSALLFAALASACADSAGGPPAPDASDATASDNATAAGADFERVFGGAGPGRDLVTLRNDLAATVFAALAAVTPPVADGTASVASGSNVTCRSEAGAVTCTVNALDSGAFQTADGRRVAHFYDFGFESAARAIGTGLSKLPNAVAVPNGSSFTVGRVTCSVLEERVMSAAPDTCNLSL